MGVQGAELAARLGRRQAPVEPLPQRPAAVEPADAQVRRREEVGRREAPPPGVGLEQQRGVAAAEPARPLAGQLVDPRVADDLRQGDERGEAGAVRAGLGQDRAEVGMVLGRGPDGGGPGHVVGPGVPHAGQHGVAGGGVDRVAVGHRADDRVPVGQPGEPGEQLADPDAGDGRGDGPELAPDAGRGVGLGVEGVELRGAAEGEQQDAAPGAAEARVGRGGRRRGPEQPGQAEAQAGEGADAEEFAPRGAVAEPVGESPDRQHDPPPPAIRSTAIPDSGGLCRSKTSPQRASRDSVAAPPSWHVVEAEKGS